MGTEPGMFPVLSEDAIEMNLSPNQYVRFGLYKKKHGLSTKLMKDIFIKGNGSNVHGSSNRQKMVI